jgi:type II secretory pathway pseudopilin PulG
MRESFMKGGFTLIELVLLIVITAILVTVALRSALTVSETAKVEQTKHELEALAYAVVGNPELQNNGVRTDFGYVGDVGAMPPNLDALVQNPGGYATWNGPYIQDRFSQMTDDYKKDAWGNLYQYAGGLTITSTSGSGIIRKLANAVNDLLQNQVSGVVYDHDGRPPGSTYQDSISVRLTIPDGAGGMVTKIAGVDAGGYFSFDSIPIGNHDIRIVYLPESDTLVRFVSVLPSSAPHGSYYLTSSFQVSPAVDSVTFQSVATASVPSNAIGVTVNKPSGTAAGDLLIACFVSDGSWGTTLSAITFPPPKPNDWKLIQGGAANPSGNTPCFGVWYKIAGASEPATYTFACSSPQELYIAILRYTGHDPTTPINASAIANSGGSTTPTAPNVTTTVDGCRILRAFGADDDDTPYTSPAGHVERYNGKSGTGSGTCGGAGADVTQTSAGATGTAAFTQNASEEWMAVTVAIAPAP